MLRAARIDAFDYQPFPLAPTGLCHSRFDKEILLKQILFPYSARLSGSLHVKGNNTKTRTVTMIVVNIGTSFKKHKAFKKMFNFRGIYLHRSSFLNKLGHG